MGLDDIIKKAKEVATDERIDQAAEQIKKVAPDSIDRHVDSAAEHAKRYNEDEPDSAERARRAAEGAGLGEPGPVPGATDADAAARRDPHGRI